jgi:curved DNA-binding protein CbpA
MSEDFYELLGVDGDATRDELKRAYREAAREYHPDVNDDDRAGAQFKTVRRAYEVLRDEDDRAEYDRLGHETYVRKRLDGLPSTRSRADEGEGASDGATGSARGGSAGPRDEASGTGADRSGTAAGSAATRSSTAGSARTGTGPNGSSTDGSAGPHREGGGHPSQERRSRHRASTSTAGGSTAGESVGGRAGSDRSASTAGSGTAGRTRRAYEPGGTAVDGRTETGSRTGGDSSDRYAALRLRWFAVFVGTALYAAGVAQYGLANEAALASYAAGVAESPALVAADAGLAGPTSFVVGALADRSAALLFPVGVAALPLVLGVTVAQYGRGGAWLYVVAAVAPLGLPTVGAAPTAATALRLTLLALPLLSAGFFLSDVGRFLLAASE